MILPRLFRKRVTQKGNAKPRFDLLHPSYEVNSNTRLLGLWASGVHDGLQDLEVSIEDDILVMLVKLLTLSHVDSEKLSNLTAF